MEKNVQALAVEVAALQKTKSTPVKAAGAAGQEHFDEGEKLFSAKDWAKAILAYQKYRERVPKGKSYPEATYKMGVCFEELGQKDEANSFYEEVISKYPNSSFAKKSKYRLTKK